MMKTIKVILLSMVFTVAFTNCKKEAAHDHDTMTMTDDMDNHNHEEADNHDDMIINESDEVQLNNGEKWVVNEEMKPYVAQGEILISNYDGDYKSLATDLTEQNNKLIKSCTMEGTSHDELHKWLHPHIEMVKELGEMSDQEMADAQVEKIKSSYEKYHNYFQ